MAAIIFFFVLEIKKGYAYEKKTQALGDVLLNVKTQEDWLAIKGQIVQHIADAYQPKYADDHTTNTLYGMLADKAEEIFKNNLG